MYTIQQKRDHFEEVRLFFFMIFSQFSYDPYLITHDEEKSRENKNRKTFYFNKNERKETREDENFFFFCILLQVLT